MSHFLNPAAAASRLIPFPSTARTRAAALALTVLCGACIAPADAAPRSGARKVVTKRKTATKRVRSHRARRPARRKHTRVYAPLMMPPQRAIAGGPVSPLPLADVPPRKMVIMHPDRGAGKPKTGAPQEKGSRVVHVTAPSAGAPPRGAEAVPRIRYGTSEARIVGE